MYQRTTSHDPLPAQVLADRVPFHLSPDGCWLALTVQAGRPDRPLGERLRQPDGVPTHLVGSRVVLVETRTGETRDPVPEKSTSWAPQWSPDGRRLAAYVRHEGPACLAIWEAASGALRLLHEAAVQTKYGFETPLWLPDNRRIAAKLRPVEPAPADAAPASVFSFDPVAPVEQDWTPSPASGYDPWQGDLGVVDGETGEVSRLARGWEWAAFRVAPDGHAVAVVRVVADPEDPVGDCFELVVVSTADGAVRRLAPRVMQEYGYCFNWSPDSRQIAYVETILITTRADRQGLARLDLETGAAELLEEAAQEFGMDSAFLLSWISSRRSSRIPAPRASWPISTGRATRS